MERPADDEKNLEIQLGGRHLALLVMGLILFGSVLFFLGRWSEHAGQPVAEVEDGLMEESLAESSEPDPAEPDNLTFYEALGKQKSPGFEEEPIPTRAAEAPPSLPTPDPRPSAPARAIPEPVKPAPPVAPAPDGERFKVQVAAMSNPEAANDLASKLRRKGYPAAVDMARDADGKTLYKVRVGDFGDRAPAEQTAARLRNVEKIGAWIVKVQG